MKINKLDLYIMLPFLLAVIFTYNYKLFYIAFLLIAIKYVVEVIRKKTELEAAAVTILVYSYIISDNFIVIGVAAVLLAAVVLRSLLQKKPTNINRRFLVLAAATVLFFLINIFLGRVPLPNLVLYAIYNFVFMAMPIAFFVFKPAVTKELDSSINTIILSQMIYIIIFIPAQFNIVLGNLFSDWAVGTLGTSGGIHLFNLFAFGAIKFLGSYVREKKIKDLIAFSVCVIFSFFTVSLATTVLFIAALVLYFLLFIPSKKLKAAFLAVTAVFSMVFWFTAHPWVKDQLKSVILDPAFRQERIKKFKTYEDTFVKLPQKDVRVGIIGVGAGYYSSRAALTASGYYISWYNPERFTVTLNPYAKKYIRPRIYQRRGLSIVDQPAAQYISIQGEYGYLGLLIFIILTALLFKNAKGANKLTLIYFLLLLSLDNYAEYPKIALLFWVTYFVLQKEKFELKVESSL